MSLFSHPTSVRILFLHIALNMGFGASCLQADDSTNPNAPLRPRAVPKVQITPLADGQASIAKAAGELTRYHFGEQNWRPYLFPLNGPSGKSLTRLGHPHDPVGHSHHNSVWIAHNDVDGSNFWSDRKNAGRIVHDGMTHLSDGDEFASLGARNRWMIDGVLKLEEYRQYRVQPLAGGETLVVVDIELHGPQKEVTLGKTPFGIFAVRVAKSMGVHDGGGRIRNSEGGVNEEGVFWKQARWCDYSGAIDDQSIEGILLMDHPANINHPTVFHVRNDGWMGASLTFDGPLAIEPGKPLLLRYGLYIHRDLRTVEELDRQWKIFADQPRPITLVPKKK